MSGSKIELVAYGEQDYYLTNNPQISYFKKAFRRHTNFVIEPFSIPLTNSTNLNDTGDTNGFGFEYSAKIPHYGDLIHKLYLEITISGTHNGTSSYTVNNFLNSLISNYYIKIGGHTIDTHYAESNQLISELTTTRQKQKVIQTSSNGGLPVELNFRSDLNAVDYDTHDRLEGHCPLFFGGIYKNIEQMPTADTLVKKKLIYNFNFWFNKNIGQALPLSPLINHEIEVYFKTDLKINLIGDNTNINSLNITKINLVGEYIHLDSDEKKRFAQSAHEYLIEQTQYHGSTTISGVNTNIKLDNFNHPIKYIYWGISNSGTAGSNRGQGPCYFVSQTNNSLYSNDDSLSNLSDNTLQIKVEGSDRIPPMPLSYFTRQLTDRYCKIPPQLDRIGIFSYALNPFDIQPSGTCNYSRIKNTEFILNFNATTLTNNKIENNKIHIYAVNYNIFRITSGLGGIVYVS